jgi:hypothetical protein
VPDTLTTFPVACFLLRPILPLDSLSIGIAPVPCPRKPGAAHALARRKNASTNRVIVDLIESGLSAQEQEKKRFFELADQLVQAADAVEQKRLKEELARMTFGSFELCGEGKLPWRSPRLGG